LRLICLDTGCGTARGPLTAVVLPSAHIVQVHADLTVTEYTVEEPKFPR
jgi:hypothetical protein